MSQSSSFELREHQSVATESVVYPTRRPPAFWDNLQAVSEIPLTRSALRELDRRNKHKSRRAQARLPRRPTTRRVVKKRAFTSIQPAEQFIRRSNRAKVNAIKRFASHGGPDLSDLRGCDCGPTFICQPDVNMSPRRSNRGRKHSFAVPQRRASAVLSKRSSASSRRTPAHETTSRTRSTGPYDRAFQQHLVNNGIYGDGYQYPETETSPPEPGNLEEIKEAMRRTRASLSPTRFTQEDFNDFRRANVTASKEWKVMSNVIPIIEGKVKDDRCISGQIPFTNLDHLTDGTIVAGNPDRYYGARPEQLNERLQEELSHHIAPSTQKDLPIAPNFFLAVKGPGGSLEVADRQASYDGALGARGIHSLRTYGRTPDFDNNAYAMTAIYQRGFLTMYTSHPVPPSTPNTRPEYVMTQVGAYALTGGLSSFREGASAYRNARDWAKQKRDEAIRAANERLTLDPAAASNPTASSPIDFGDASEDELAN